MKPVFFPDIQRQLEIEEVRETHISWALLSRQYVYKVKKPLAFSFLDYSTLEKRKHFIFEEIRLNSRFSQRIYLEVLKVVKKGKQYQVFPLTEEGEAQEYLLKMRRIQQKEFLASQLNSLTSQEIQQIGVNIANLFRSLPFSLKESRKWGNFSLLSHNVLSNLEEIRSFSYLPSSLLTYFHRQTESFLEKYQSLFEARQKKGFVIDGHGDLRLEHVYWTKGQLGLIDCVEFNPRFRFNDVVSEIAFLSMELDQRGEIHLSDALLSGFFQVYKEEEGKDLLNFYRLYRALVRLKVTLFLLKEKTLPKEEEEKKKKELTRLLHLAECYSWNLEKPQLLVFYGLMGSGKSTFGREMEQNFPLVYLTTDVIRKELYKIPLDQPIQEKYGEGIYSLESRKQVYHRMFQKALPRIKQRRMVILDGSFSKKEYWEKLKPFSSCAICRFVYFHAPKEVLLTRLKKRWQQGSVSDGRPELLTKQKQEAEFPPSHLSLLTTKAFHKNWILLLEHIAHWGKVKAEK